MRGRDGTRPRIERARCGRGRALDDDRNRRTSGRIVRLNARRTSRRLASEYHRTEGEEGNIR